MAGVSGVPLPAEALHALDTATATQDFTQPPPRLMARCRLSLLDGASGELLVPPCAASEPRPVQRHAGGGSHGELTFSAQLVRPSPPPQGSIPPRACRH